MTVKTLDDLLAEGVAGRGVLVRSDRQLSVSGELQDNLSTSAA